MSQVEVFVRYLGVAGAEEMLAESDQLQGDEIGRFPSGLGLKTAARPPSFTLFIVQNKKLGVFL